VNPKAQLLAVLIALLLPTGFLAARSSAPPRAFALDLPERIADFHFASESELAPDVLAQLEPDEYAMRLYEPDEGDQPLWLYLALYSGVGSKTAHSPEVCYPAQGWAVTDTRQVEIDMGDGDTLRVRMLETVNAGQHESVLYWFQPNGRWRQTDAAEQLLRIYDGLLGTPQYGFVRLSIRLGTEEGRQRAEDSLVNVARELAPRIRAMLGEAVTVAER
jgi:EpsI family protein